MQCKAIQYSDLMMCECGNEWDVNDPNPPNCHGVNLYHVYVCNLALGLKDAAMLKAET